MPGIGVIGTLVLDTIHLAADREASDVAVRTGLGGIAYTLAALDVALPADWTVRPLVKVGADLRQAADVFLDGLGCDIDRDGVLTVPEANNRVELHYGSGPRRCEKLTGGVPGWTWSELAPLVDRCDAVLLNFIAGWEVDLPTAQRLRARRRGLLYADIHSLLLSTGPDGVRTLRPLPAWPAWRACFDVLQMNEEELTALTPPGASLRSTARNAVRDGGRTLFVTRDARGVRWYHRTAAGIEEGSLPAEAIDATLVDPTGCGDVWGAACLSSLLARAAPDVAARTANRYAAVAAGHRGTAGLADRLRELVPAVSRA